MLPFPQRWRNVFLTPLLRLEGALESVGMRLYRAALAAQSHRERLEWLGTCDTFDFARHAARDTRGRI